MVEKLTFVMFMIDFLGKNEPLHWIKKKYNLQLLVAFIPLSFLDEQGIQFSTMFFLVHYIAVFNDVDSARADPVRPILFYIYLVVLFATAIWVKWFS